MNNEVEEMTKLEELTLYFYKKIKKIIKDKKNDDNIENITEAFRNAVISVVVYYSKDIDDIDYFFTSSREIALGVRTKLDVSGEKK